MFQSLAGLVPPYLADCHLVSLTDHHLRSADSRTSVVPRTNTQFVDRRFSTSGPKIWNSLPPALKTACNSRTQLCGIMRCDELNKQQKPAAKYSTLLVTPVLSKPKNHQWQGEVELVCKHQWECIVPNVDNNPCRVVGSERYWSLVQHFTFCCIVLKHVNNNNNNNTKFIKHNNAVKWLEALVEQVGRAVNIKQ